MPLVEYFKSSKMNVPWQLLFLIFLLSVTVNDSKKLCQKKFNYCKNSICKCPEGLKANKDKTCCVHICENKCFGGKCVGKNKCKCLPGHIATEVPNVCEPICSNCTNGYCYGYEMCANHRYKSKAKLQFPSNDDYTNTPSDILMEESTTRLSVERSVSQQSKSTERYPEESSSEINTSTHVVDEAVTETISTLLEKQSISTPAVEIETDLENIVRDERIPTTMPPVDSNEITESSKKSISDKTYETKAKESIEFELKLSNQSFEEEGLNTIHELRLEEILNHSIPLLKPNGESSTTFSPEIDIDKGTPADESRDNSLPTGNANSFTASSNSDKVQIVDKPLSENHKTTLLEEQNTHAPTDGRHVEMIVWEELVTARVPHQTVSQHFKSVEGNKPLVTNSRLILPDTSADKHKYFSSELRMAAVPIGVGLLIAIAVVGLFVGNHYHRQQSYNLLLDSST